MTGYPGYAPLPQVGTTDPNELRLPFYGASFRVAIGRFFKNFVRFHGRASQSEYWWAMLLTWIINMIMSIVIAAGVFIVVGVSILGLGTGSATFLDSATLTEEESLDLLFGMIFGSMGIGVVVLIIAAAFISLISLALAIPTLSLTWRRLQDANQHGAMQFAYFGAAVLGSFIPLIGGLAALVIYIPGLLPSNPAGRRFDEPDVRAATGYPEPPPHLPQLPQSPVQPGGYAR